MKKITQNLNKIWIIAFIFLVIFSLASIFNTDVSTVQSSAPTNGLIGYWKLDEGSGITASDSVGTNHGTLTNGPTWALGKVGSAVNFNGVNNYISLPNIDVVGTGITIAAWVKLSAADTSSDYRIISKATTWSEDDHWWMLGTTNSAGTKLRARLKAGGVTQTLVASSGNLSVGVWHHAVLRYDGTTMKLYLDGVEVGSVSKTGTLDTNVSAPVNIGRNPGTPDTGYINGSVDEVRIYNRALSVAEIIDVMNDTGDPPPPPDTTPPSVPTGLSATAISSSQINLSWTASTDNVGVTGYRIYRCQGTSCTPSVQVATSATNSYSDTALSASTAYVYAVAAYDAAGNVSAQSTSASATTTSPTPPVISAVAASSITSNGATITWTTDQPSDTQVEYGLTTAYGSATTLNTSLVTAHSQTLSGLTPNTLYHYRVKSRNASGQLATSGDFTFMTPASPPVISNVQVVNISNNSVTITWNTDKPSTSKVNYGPTSSYTSSTAKDNVLVTSHLVSIDGLNPLTLYHYQVESTDLENLTAVSADSTFTTSPAPIIRQLTNRLLHIFIELSRKILQVIWSH
jgi:chitodextrinase